MGEDWERGYAHEREAQLLEAKTAWAKMLIDNPNEASTATRETNTKLALISVGSVIAFCWSAVTCSTVIEMSHTETLAKIEAEHARAKAYQIHGFVTSEGVAIVTKETK